MINALLCEAEIKLPEEMIEMIINKVSLRIWVFCWVFLMLFICCVSIIH